MKKTAIILFTGDRIDWVDYTINSCKKFIQNSNVETTLDIFLITWLDYVETSHEIKILKYDKPLEDMIRYFPRSKQQGQYDEQTQQRISFGHCILFGIVPDIIYQNKDIFIQYDYILKCRSDLVFDPPIFNFSDRYLYTFECFWGGCRYIRTYSNDHFLFGISNEVLNVISYQYKDCKIDSFWNPESYMTHLLSNSNLDKIELTTDKYYLLSKDRDSRKFIGYPMETINQNDVNFFQRIGIDINKIKFTNKYDF